VRPPPRPPQGYPWEQPGHRFWTPGFPPKYEPHLAREALMKPSEKFAETKADRPEHEKGKY
jgi:hypothetical protein